MSVQVRGSLTPSAAIELSVAAIEASVTIGAGDLCRCRVVVDRVGRDEVLEGVEIAAVDGVAERLL